MLAVKDTGLISPEEYLQGEPLSEVKHELIAGHVYAMAGASANHERLSVNVLSEFRNHLKGSPCEPFGSDMKVRVGSNFFYPDVTVDCHFDDSEPYFTEPPILIVEVDAQNGRNYQVDVVYRYSHPARICADSTGFRGYSSHSQKRGLVAEALFSRRRNNF